MDKYLTYTKLSVFVVFTDHKSLFSEKSYIILKQENIPGKQV